MRQLGKQGFAVTDRAEYTTLHLDHVDRGIVIAAIGRSATVLEQQAFEPAIAVFETALERKQIPLHWRYQVLFRLGKCYEKAGNPNKALETWYDCLNTEQDPERPMSPEEYDWYFRAGDSAWLMLVDRKNWKAAIAIARRLGKIPGPRAQVALERARKLELQHFIWDDSE